MNRRTESYFLIVLVASLLVPIVSWSGRLDEAEKTPDWKTLIKSEIQTDRISAQQMVLDKRKDTIGCLLSVLNSPVEKGEEFFTLTTSRNIAITLLGKLRAKEAVTDLTGWLAPKPGQATVIWNPRILTPAGYALFEIGLPAVLPLVELLKSEAPAPDSYSLRRDQTIKIIASIKGVAETEFFFEDVLAKETDQAKKHNLKVALDLLRDRKFRKILEHVHDRLNRLQ